VQFKIVVLDVGLGTNCTTTADEENVIEMKIKTKMADNIKRYELLQFLACRIGNILWLFCEPAAVQTLKLSTELRELLHSGGTVLILPYLSTVPSIIIGSTHAVP
jgi:hypothetical protein